MDTTFPIWVIIFAIGQLLWRLRSSVREAGHANAAETADDAATGGRLFDEALTGKVRFDASGWTFVSKEHGSWVWRDELGGVLGLQVLKGSLGPVESDGDVVSYCRDNISFTSSLVEARPMRATSFRGLVCIEKSERRPGYAYLGRLHVLLEEQTIILWIVAVEKGVTGVRESAVAGEALHEGRISIPASLPSGARVPGWFADPYDAKRNDRTICSISDDEQYDERFPAHPLSRIRKALRQVEGTFEIQTAAKMPSDPWPHQPLESWNDPPATIH